MFYPLPSGPGRAPTDVKRRVARLAEAAPGLRLPLPGLLGGHLPHGRRLLEDGMDSIHEGWELEARVRLTAEGANTAPQNDHADAWGEGRGLASAEACPINN